jgi:DNA-binding transcriptional LysR family regulator
MWLVPRLARFRKKHAGIDVRITATHEVVDMEREGIDLAIRDCAADTPPAGALELVGEHLSPVCSPSYLEEARAAKRPLAKPEDLKHHCLLYLHDPTGRSPWLSWPVWLEAMGIEELQPAGTMGFGQYDQVIQGAIHGQGIALGRMSLAARLLKDRQLVALFGRRQRIARSFYAVHARFGHARPEARLFVEWIRDELAREG